MVLRTVGTVKLKMKWNYSLVYPIECLTPCEPGEAYKDKHSFSILLCLYVMSLLRVWKRLCIVYAYFASSELGLSAATRLRHKTHKTLDIQGKMERSEKRGAERETDDESIWLNMTTALVLGLS